MRICVYCLRRMSVLCPGYWLPYAVYDGEDALAYLQSGNYDAAVLDIMMPGMDGLTVLKKVRSAGSTLPILMLTPHYFLRAVHGEDMGL